MSTWLVLQLQYAPDSLWLCDGEVEEGWAGRLHAGIPGWHHPTFPLEGSPALGQKVHQQGWGVKREQHLPGTFLCRQVAQSWEEIPGERKTLSWMPALGHKSSSGYVIVLIMNSPWLVLTSLPQRFFARPGPSLLRDGHVGHPVREPLLWAFALKVAPRVANQERQQRGHFLLQTGSLLGQPRAQRAECGEDERVAITTWFDLREQEEKSNSVLVTKLGGGFTVQKNHYYYWRIFSHKQRFIHETFATLPSWLV